MSKMIHITMDLNAFNKYHKGLGWPTKQKRDEASGYGLTSAFYADAERITIEDENEIYVLKSREECSPFTIKK